MNNQIINGFQVNPVLPNFMDTKPLDKRSKSHLEKWFLTPYIVIVSFDSESYNSYRKRISNLSFSIDMMTEKEFTQWNIKRKKVWLKAWKKGFRYDVRCLDGGCWDRTTNRGNFDTLDKALAECKKMCA
jgi:hypothetical protein